MNGDGRDRDGAVSNWLLHEPGRVPAYVWEGGLSETPER